MRKIWAFALLASLYLGACSKKQSDSRPGTMQGYVIQQSEAVTLQGGVEAQLEISWDARLAGVKDPKGSSVNAGGVDAPEINPPYLGARMCVLADSFTDRRCLDLAFPLVRIEATDLKGPSQVIALKSDESTGVGSYNGIVTRFFTLGKQGEVLPLMASPAGVLGAKAEPIELQDTLKAAWRQQGPETLLYVSCGMVGQVQGPDGSQAQFETRYSRFSFESGHWVWRQKAKSGIWENEGVFPARSEFP